MSLASLDDINQHLPGTLQITDLLDDPWQTDAERVVKGYLSGVYSSSLLASWSTPGATPALIRSIAGRLIASWFYASKVSGEVPDWNDYSDAKYKEAIAWLEQIRTGDLILYDVTEEITTGDRITADDFYPNNDQDPAPMFTIGKQFA